MSNSTEVSNSTEGHLDIVSGCEGNTIDLGIDELLSKKHATGALNGPEVETAAMQKPFSPISFKPHQGFFQVQCNKKFGLNKEQSLQYDDST